MEMNGINFIWGYWSLNNLPASRLRNLLHFGKTPHFNQYRGVVSMSEDPLWMIDFYLLFVYSHKHNLFTCQFRERENFQKKVWIVIEKIANWVRLLISGGKEEKKNCPKILVKLSYRVLHTLSCTCRPLENHLCPSLRW